jgi:hypothetical protein
MPVFPMPEFPIPLLLAPVLPLPSAIVVSARVVATYDAKAKEGGLLEPVEKRNGELSSGGTKEERIVSWGKDGRETAAIFLTDIVLELGGLYHRKGTIRERTRVRMRMKIKTNCSPRSDSLDQRFQCNNVQMCVRMHACMHNNASSMVRT